MPLLLIAAITAITITTTACAATSATYAAAGAATRTIHDIVGTVAAASQIEGGDLPMSGYQGP